jgi:3-oxoacyl-[acyl-carrier-protein] synthase-3
MKHIINNAQILGISSCLPCRSIELDSNFLGVSDDEIKKIKSITGIKQVRYVEEGTTAADLCMVAAQHLLESLSIDVSAVDAIIFVSQSRDYIAPNTSSVLQDKMKISKEALSIDLPNGCSGYIHGLFLSHLLVTTGAAKRVLLMCGETNSGLINQKDRSMAMIFGDAGTATLIAKGHEESTYFNIKTDGSGFNKIIISHGGARNPLTPASLAVTERENNNFRADIDLFMDGMSVFNFAITEVPQIISESLLEAGISFESIDLFALHQANELIINQVSKKLKIDPAKIPFLASNVGNTGPASIPLLLSMGYSDSSSLLNNVMICGFGVGLNWGTAICNLSKTKICPPVEYINNPV